MHGGEDGPPGLSAFLLRALRQLAFVDDAIVDDVAHVASSTLSQALVAAGLGDRQVARALSAVWHVPLHDALPDGDTVVHDDTMWSGLPTDDWRALHAVPLARDDEHIVVGVTDPTPQTCFALGVLDGDVQLQVVPRGFAVKLLDKRRAVASDVSWSDTQTTTNPLSWDDLEEVVSDGAVSNAWRAMETGTNLAQLESDQLIQRFSGAFDVSMLREKHADDAFDLDVAVDLDLDFDASMEGAPLVDAEEAPAAPAAASDVQADAADEDVPFVFDPEMSMEAGAILDDEAADNADADAVEAVDDDADDGDPAMDPLAANAALADNAALLPPPRVFEREAPTRLDATGDIAAQQRIDVLGVHQAQLTVDAADAGGFASVDDVVQMASVLSAEDLDDSDDGDAVLDIVDDSIEQAAPPAAPIELEPQPLPQPMDASELLLDDDDLSDDDDDDDDDAFDALAPDVIAADTPEADTPEADAAEPTVMRQVTLRPEPADDDSDADVDATAAPALAIDDMLDVVSEEDATESFSIPLHGVVDAVSPHADTHLAPEVPTETAAAAPAPALASTPGSQEGQTRPQNLWDIPATQNSEDGSDEALSDVARQAVTTPATEVAPSPLVTPPLPPSDAHELSDLEAAEAAAAAFVAQWGDAPSTGSEGAAPSSTQMAGAPSQDVAPASAPSQDTYIGSPQFTPVSVAADSGDEHTNPELYDSFDAQRGVLPTALRMALADDQLGSSASGDGGFADSGGFGAELEDAASGFEESAFTNTRPVLESPPEDEELSISALRGGAASMPTQRKMPTLMDDGMLDAVGMAAGTGEEKKSLDGFELHDRLGSGGMAEVVRATRKSHDDQVALKMVHSHLTDDVDTRKRFTQEATLWAEVQHENVVRVLESHPDAQRPHLACELITGGTVNALVKAMGKVPPLVAAVVVTDLLRALAACHSAGILHRDVKPENLLIHSDGRVLLADFGVACRFDDQGKAGMEGTALYMSPEQVRAKPLDERSDLYSAGVLLYEMLVGKNPFITDNPSATLLKITEGEVVPLFEMDPTVPALLEHVAERLMHQDRDQRYPSAQHALQDLLTFLLPQSDAIQGLLTRARKMPQSTAEELSALQADAEAERAKALSTGSKSQRAQSALAFRRSFLLQPQNQEVRAALRAAKDKDGFDFDAKGSNRLVAMRQALRDNPDDEGLLRRLADAYRQQGDLVRGVTFQKRLLRLRPDEDAVLQRLQYMVGDTDEHPYGTGFCAKWYGAGSED